MNSLSKPFIHLSPKMIFSSSAFLTSFILDKSPFNILLSYVNILLFSSYGENLQISFIENSVFELLLDFDIEED